MDAQKPTWADVAAALERLTNTARENRELTNRVCEHAERLCAEIEGVVQQRLGTQPTPPNDIITKDDFLYIGNIVWCWAHEKKKSEQQTQQQHAVADPLPEPPAVDESDLVETLVIDAVAATTPSTLLGLPAMTATEQSQEEKLPAPWTQEESEDVVSMFKLIYEVGLENLTTCKEKFIYEDDGLFHDWTKWPLHEQVCSFGWPAIMKGLKSQTLGSVWLVTLLIGECLQVLGDNNARHAQRQFDPGARSSAAGGAASDGRTPVQLAPEYRTGYPSLPASPCLRSNEKSGINLLRSNGIRPPFSTRSSREMLQSIPELLANLPTEVVIDILVRLPVKKLLCFRCVSKPFLALIDSPVFVKLHINHSIKARNNQNLIVKVTSFHNRHVATYSINVDTVDVAEEIDLPLKVGYGDKYAPTFVGSCNGLLLLSYEKYKGCDEIIVVIWNPFTRKYRKLPTIQIEYPDYILRYKTYGVGYDSIHDDYKVLRMAEWGNKVDRASFSEIQVYSLKSNTWRRIPNFSYDLQYIMLPYERYGVFSSGALHWLVSEKSSGSRFIAAFDVATEEYQLMPVPNFIDKNDIFIHVTVLEGSLCMCNQRRESIDVWMMRNYGVGESWIKLFSVSSPVDMMNFALFTLLALSKDGIRVLYMHNRHNGGLIWFDLEHNSEERIYVLNVPRRFSVQFVMQSLVSLGSESQTYGTKQHKEEPGIKV